MHLTPQTGFRSILEWLKRSWQSWSRLPWGRRILALGVAIFVVMLAARSTSGILRTCIDVAGFLTFYGTIIVTGTPRIKKVKDKATRIAILGAFIPFVAGSILIPAGLLILVYDYGLGTRFAVYGSVLLLASIAIFFITNGAVDAIDLLGLATGVLVALSLLIGMFLFPPVIVFLLSTGQWPSFLLGPQVNNEWIDLVSIVPLVVLFVVPDLVLRRVCKWEDTSPKARQIVPGWIASIALAFTCLYAIELHFSSANPLTAISLPGIALATLFVGVIIWPLYRNVAASFWRLGIAESVKLKDWRSDQRIVYIELKKSVMEKWRNRPKKFDSPDATEDESDTSQASEPSSERLLRT